MGSEFRHWYETLSPEQRELVTEYGNAQYRIGWRQAKEDRPQVEASLWREEILPLVKGAAKSVTVYLGGAVMALPVLMESGTVQKLLDATSLSGPAKSIIMALGAAIIANRFRTSGTVRDKAA